MRWRRSVTRLVGAAIALQLFVAVPLALAPPAPTHQLRTIAIEGATTTTTQAPDATTTTAAAVPATTTVSPPHRTTTTLVCHNSTNPACGPFRWIHDPGPSHPLTITFDVSPAQPHAGEQVTIKVRFQNPDASSFVGLDGPCPGEGGCLAWSRFERCDTRYGPWDPPAHEPLDHTVTFPHVYPHAGVYRLSAGATVLSHDKCEDEYEPYKSDGYAVFDLVVDPAPSSTTSTTSTTTLR